MYRVLYAFSAAWGPTVGLLAGSSLCLGVAYAPGIPLILLGYRLKTDARRRMFEDLKERCLNQNWPVEPSGHRCLRAPCAVACTSKLTSRGRGCGQVLVELAQARRSLLERGTSITGEHRC